MLNAVAFQAPGERSRTRAWKTTEFLVRDNYGLASMRALVPEPNLGRSFKSIALPIGRLELSRGAEANLPQDDVAGSPRSRGVSATGLGLPQFTYRRLRTSSD